MPPARHDITPARPAAITKQMGQAANQAAARATFARDLIGKSTNTIRRKRADLDLFADYLQETGIPASGGDLFKSPQAWRGIVWGIVEGFKFWQLKKGYAIGSINGRLSTVRTFARLANRAGAIGDKESRLIDSVTGFIKNEKIHADEQRQAQGIQTRIGHKKPAAVIIPEDIASSLISQQPNTPRGKRDRLLLCLLLEHGLRVGEIAILTVKSFDLKAGLLFFYRPKVSKEQTHQLTPATQESAKNYLPLAPEDGILWRKSCKGGGKLSGQMSQTSAARALTKVVMMLGRKAGLMGLSAHDARHFWATYEANNNTPINRLMEAGGWASPAMPLRYIEAARIANEGTARLKRKA